MIAFRSSLFSFFKNSLSKKTLFLDLSCFLINAINFLVAVVLLHPTNFERCFHFQFKIFSNFS